MRNVKGPVREGAPLTLDRFPADAAPWMAGMLHEVADGLQLHDDMTGHSVSGQCTPRLAYRHDLVCQLHSDRGSWSMIFRIYPTCTTVSAAGDILTLMESEREARRLR